MTMPTHTNKNYLSAAVMREWQQTITRYQGVARSARGMFADNRAGNAYTWTGYILYTGTTNNFYYHFNTTGAASTLKVNDVTVNSWAASGTKSGSVTLSGLTAGEVYKVELTTTATYVLTVYWLGLTYTPSLTSIPTFAALGTTYTAAEIDVIATAIDELAEIADDMPIMPTVQEEYNYTIDNADPDGPYTVWKGRMHYTGNAIRWTVFGRADDNHAIAYLEINGSVVDDMTLLNDSTSTTYEIDISAEGLTLGSAYDVEVWYERTGTSGDVSVECRVVELVNYSLEDGDALTTVQAGDAITNTILNEFATVRDNIHPSAASPIMLLLYYQPAVKVSNCNRYYIQHNRPILRYISDGTNTAEVETATGDTSLPSGTSYDLGKITGLTIGQKYTVDDALFAQEYFT